METEEVNMIPDKVLKHNLEMLSSQRSADSTNEYQSLLSPAPARATSFFTAHQLKTHGMVPHPFKKYQPDWILGLLLFCFILLSWVQVFYSRRLSQIVMAPYSKRFLSQLIRDGDLFSERIMIATVLIYLITTALFLFEMNNQFFLQETVSFVHGLPLFTLIILCLLGFWTLKIGLIRFLSFIFKTRQTSRDYLLNILIFNILTGLFLLPLLVFAIYLKWNALLWVCTTIFALFMIFRFIRGFLIGISIRKFSYLFLFVYLCSLEILPLIVILKVVLKYYL